MFLNWPFATTFCLFSYFLQTFNTKYVKYNLPMPGFEPGSSGIGSQRAVNCATTTVPSNPMMLQRQRNVFYCLWPFAIKAEKLFSLVNKVLPTGHEWGSLSECVTRLRRGQNSTKGKRSLNFVSKNCRAPTYITLTFYDQHGLDQ